MYPNRMKHTTELAKGL
ncbi:hypothetical protein LINPERHAP1_LOCUS20748 [Linum perenne]